MAIAVVMAKMRRGLRMENSVIFKRVALR